MNSFTIVKIRVTLKYMLESFLMKK